jgi:hypothetical protein
LAGLFSVAAVAIIAVFVAVMGDAGWRQLSSRQVAVLTAFCGVVALLLAGSLFSLIRPGSRRSYHPSLPLLALAIGYPVSAILLFPLADTTHFLLGGVRCLGAGLAVASLAAACAWLIVKRGYVLNPGLTGLVIGGLGGVVAAASLQAFCPDQNAVHLAVWHSATLLAAMFGGWLAHHVI